MAFTLYDASVANYLQILGGVSGYLNKGLAHFRENGVDPETIVETRLLDPGREAEKLAQADVVLVDAPCSGSGTWRRNPKARWRLTPRELERVTAIQSRLLDVAAELVRPGGRLVFVTCSVLDAEGADQAAAFLSRHGDWRAERLALGAGETRGEGTRLTPARDGTDGFFIARFGKLC